jgi:hypothetical protein
VSNAEDFARQAEAVRDRLYASVGRGGLGDDPLGEVVASIGDAMGVLAAHARLQEAQREPVGSAAWDEIARKIDARATMALKQAAASVALAQRHDTRAKVLLGLAAYGLVAFAFGAAAVIYLRG